MAKIFKRSLFFVLASLILLSTSASAQDAADAKAEQTQKYWADFMHYALIGNFELAKDNANKLIQSDPDPVQVLDLAENSRYADAYRNLSLMQENTQELRDVAKSIVQIVEEGRYLRRKNPKRIEDEIKRLSSTTRGHMLAVSRLKDSGEWAVPQIVNALRDSNRRDELEVIKRALPKLGRDAVNPLAVAMLYCKDLNLKLIIADVLGEIGYHKALPYLQEIVEDENTVSDLRSVAEEAIEKITTVNSLPNGVNSAMLYERLANDYYNELDSLKVPENQEIANVWFWDYRKGLYKEEVPRGAFDELMTMRYAEHALRRDSSLAGSVAIWLSAFFRLEANGFEQPQYFGEGHADADTYALTSGPEYLHRVLKRALDNRNRPVALKAIKAMRRNAGQGSLLYELMGKKPLVDALSYPDREVRFSAALAIGQVLPLEEFEAAPMVIKILSEAVQQRGQKYAVVIDPDHAQRNKMMSDLRETYTGGVIGSDSYANIVTKVRELPSVDLVVISNKVTGLDLPAILELMNKQYRLAFCPTVVIADSENLPSTKAVVKDYPFVSIKLRGITAAEMPAVASEIMAANNAREFSAELADGYALAAARTLEALCVTRNSVLPLIDSQSALLGGLKDSRAEIQQSSIIALGRLESTDAQRELADMALNDATEYDIRLMLLDSLSFSARQFGNLLNTDQTSGLYKIASSFDADPKLRNLACQAYGSLSLPSAKVSTLVLDQSKNQK